MTEQVACLVGEVRVDRDEVRALQQIIEFDAFGACLGLDFGRQLDSVAIQDGHTEALRTSSDGLPDATEADDAHHFVVDVLTEHHQRSPDPGCPSPKETLTLTDAA